jgi:dienelactone hydrolase
MHMRRLPLPALCLLAIAPLHAADVTIAIDGANRRVTTPQYEAVVADDGCLTSLRVGGVEFLRSAPGIPRGAYFFQGGVLKLPDVQQVGDATVEAKSDKASVRYQFAPASQTWTLANATDERMVLVMVFDPAVRAMRDGEGLWWHAPLELGTDVSTWFRDRARLRVSGSTRLWGPWAGEHQVWEVALGPKETRTVALEIGSATDDEAAEAARIAAQVPTPPTDPIGPMWDLQALSQLPAVYPADGFSAESVKALFYDGPPFRGRATRVFACVGLPDAPAGAKVPGMVLVHGGGGTAFAEWVRLWTGRGYAAIAMDTCGCVPKGSYGNWERAPLGGPAGWGGWGQTDWPREDQWTYHAVADILLAHSLLRSLPEVDPDRIGLTGISWGGYLVSIVAGVDPRLRFVVPVYGCGYTLDTTFAGSVTGLGEERAARWMRWWDPSVYLKDAAMPMLWVTGSNDFAFTFPALQKSYRTPKGPQTLCIRLRMPHGHGGPGENPEEIRVFADSILKGGEPLAKVTGQGREGREVWATFESVVPVVKAELNTTRDTGAWPDRKWDAAPAQVEGARVTATLPEGTTVYYLNLFDRRDCVVSTEHVELTP